MIDTVKYASLLEYTQRTGKTVPELKAWAHKHGILHPRLGWLVNRAHAEELLAQDR